METNSPKDLANQNNSKAISTSQISDELKTYLKIKKVNIPEDRSYLKISTDRTKLNFIDNLKRSEIEKSVTFENNKIFMDEENSYIYEEVCRDAVKDFINGQNYNFITYGLTHSGKTGSLFGGVDCDNNINSRGILFRFLESLMLNINSKIVNKEFALSFSYICVNSNKYVDLLNLQKSDIDSNFNEKELTVFFKDYKATTDLSTLLIKSPIIEVTEIISFFKKVRSLFLKLENSDRKYYSKSHFSFFVYLTNLKTNKFSTCAFTVLAGSEKSGLQNPVSSGNGTVIGGNISKTRDGIYIQNSFSTLLNVISQLKSPDYKKEKFNEVPFDDCTLTYCLKSFLKNSKIRILGTIVPNIGYQESVKDTLMFLFRFRKNVFGKSSNNQQAKVLNDKNDEILYELENKLKNKEKHVQKLNEQIETLNKRFEDSENLHRKNIETLKNAFKFDGDVQRLNSNDESFPEVKYARNIRDSIEQNKILNKKIIEFEKKILDLKEEIKKVNNEKRIIEDDRLALGNYLKIKEENLHEENKMKILLENSKELDELKRKNEMLEKQIEEYKKALVENAKTIHNLPNILKENIEERKEIAKKREELKGHYDKNMKQTTKNLEKKYTIEIESTTSKFEKELKYKEETLKKLNDDYHKQKKEHEEEVSQINNELVNFYLMVNPILECYQKDLEPIITKLINNYFNGTNSLQIQAVKTTNNFFSGGNTKERISSAKINSANFNSNLNNNNLNNASTNQNQNNNVNPNLTGNCMNNSNLNINLLFKQYKEKFDKMIDSMNIRLNRYNFPIIYCNIDHLNNSNTKNRPMSSNNFSSNPLPRTSLLNLLKNTSKYNFIETNTKNLDEKKTQNIITTNNNKTETKNKNNNLGNDLELLMEMNTNNLNSKNNSNLEKNNKDLSISASDISMEMEKVEGLKLYTIEEIEKMSHQSIVKIVNDSVSKVKDLENFFIEVKKEKRGYHKLFKKDNHSEDKDFDPKKQNCIDKYKDYIKKLEKENEKLNLKIDGLMKSIFSLKTKRDVYESKLFENISATNIGFNMNKEKNKSTAGNIQVETGMLSKNDSAKMHIQQNTNNMIARNLLTANNTKLRPLSSTGKIQVK